MKCENCLSSRTRIIKELNSGRYEFMKNQWIECKDCGDVKYIKQIPMGVFLLTEEDLK